MNYYVKTPPYKLGTGNSDIKLYGDWEGFIVVDTHGKVKDSVKKMIKNLLLNATGAFIKDTNPRFELVMSCYIEGAFVDFNSLSKEVKGQILDEILYKNRTHGEFVEHGEIIKQQ